LASLAILLIIIGSFLIICSFRQEGLANDVLQWYLCRMEGWFATDAETISLQSWDKVNTNYYFS
jgi:hypothetical protein